MLTGKTVKNWNTVSGTFTGKGVLTSESNGIQYAKVAAMTVNTNTVPGANGDKLYGYLTADPYTTKYENENVVAYPIWTGSENTTVYEKGSAIKDGVKAGDAIQYHLDGNFVGVDAGLMIPLTLMRSPASTMRRKARWLWSNMRTVLPPP